MYPPELVKPMREELTSVGFEEFSDADQVEAAISQSGTVLCCGKFSLWLCRSKCKTWCKNVISQC